MCLAVHCGGGDAFCSGVELFAAVAATLSVSGECGRERVDDDALAAHYLWNYLDWAAVFFQFCEFSIDEGAGTRDSSEGVSGADVADDGVVPVVFGRDGADGDELFFPAAGDGCAQRGESGTRVALVWMVVAGVAWGVRVDLWIATAHERFAGQRLGACRWDCDCGDGGVVDCAGTEWRRDGIERAFVDQRGRGAWTGDAAEYLGRSVARAEAADCVDERGGWGDADARGGGAADAMGIYHRAGVAVVIVSDVVFYGRG